MLNAAKQIRGVGRIYEKAMDLKKTRTETEQRKKKPERYGQKINRNERKYGTKNKKRGQLFVTAKKK